MSVTNGKQIAVIGSGVADSHLKAIAFEVGSRIAGAGLTLLCGGRAGVMEGAAEGAKAAGGLTVGVLPGTDALQSPPNEHLDVTLFTGMGQARNQILVLSADAVIAIGGGWGTLNEIGLAMKHGIRTVLLESWQLEHPSGEVPPELIRCDTPAAALEAVLRRID
jgi:uncharacterized protein (TIGR00725 family)